MHKWIAGAVVAALATPGLASDWQSESIADHLKGRIGVGALVGGVLEDRGKQRMGRLRAYCAENSTVVNVEAEYIFFGLTGGLAVRYSLDGGPVASAQWDVCVGGRCAGLWSGQGIPFLKALFGKRELKMVISRSFAEPINATFHIEGAKESLEPVGQACGWLPKTK